MAVIPVIDLFSGPGGLGEGFSRESSVDFRIAVSIEKDPMAFQTLRLRAAFRELVRSPAQEATWERWDDLIEETPWRDLFDTLQNSENALIRAACKVAAQEALNLELGPTNRSDTSREIRRRLSPFMTRDRLPRNAVLIGGPPCQAYSMVGRSRNKGKIGYRAEEDHRHFLYLEYLHVIAEFEPAMFVMENVKGILTSKVQDAQIFETIMRDLKHPGAVAGSMRGAQYVLCALSEQELESVEPAADHFIVKAEEYGVPQARHRVIILGVRRDVFDAAVTVGKLACAKPVSVWDVIADLPPLRPRLSYRGNGLSWLHALNGHLFESAIRELRGDRQGFGPVVAERMLASRAKLQARQLDPGSGNDRARWGAASRQKAPKQLADWLKDRPSSLLANHESRSHMPSDLVRYLFVAAFGEEIEASPRLQDFPKTLLPEHKNVDRDNVAASIFKDRFRVQLANDCAMTVTSHIAKDGHAFIHPKSMQCRSLTVREAARLQTFPDSYVFLGNRTSQYTQVGNAVPPLLAAQIAKIVADTMSRAGLTSDPRHLDTSVLAKAA